MKMVKLLSLFCILVWLASSVNHVFADSRTNSNVEPGIKQSPLKGKDVINERLNSINKRLGLSAEQQAEIKLILQDDAAKLKELRENANLTIEEKKSTMKELRNATNSEIRATLTSEQQQKHDAILSKSEEKRKNRENRNVSPPIK